MKNILLILALLACFGASGAVETVRPNDLTTRTNGTGLTNAVKLMAGVASLVTTNDQRLLNLGPIRLFGGEWGFSYDTGTETLNITNAHPELDPHVHIGSLNMDEGSVTGTFFVNGGSGSIKAGSGNLLLKGETPGDMVTTDGAFDATKLAGTLPALNGSALISLNASSLASGTVANARLPDPVTFSVANVTTLSLTTPLRGDQVAINFGANGSTNGSGTVTVTGGGGGSGIATTNGLGTNTVFYGIGRPAITAIPETGQGSNWLGGITVATNIATILQTNFISGKLYTNATGRNQTVYSSAFLVTAAVTGAANMLIQEDFTGNTTIATVASAVVGTVPSTVATTYIQQVRADIVPWGVYAFTNTSTGAGNSTSLQSGTGFIRTY